MEGDGVCRDRHTLLRFLKGGKSAMSIRTHLALSGLALCLCLTLTPAAIPAQAAAKDSPSAKDFYKLCKSARSDNSEKLKACYIDAFVELRKSGDVSGKCAPGLIGLISQPHTHFMRLQATMKDNKPADEETLIAYQQRILSWTYPCN